MNCICITSEEQGNLFADIVGKTTGHFNAREHLFIVSFSKHTPKPGFLYMYQ